MAEESHLQGEHTPGVRELYNRQQCHTSSPHSVVIFKNHLAFLQHKCLWLTDIIKYSHYNA